MTRRAGKDTRPTLDIGTALALILFLVGTWWVGAALLAFKTAKSPEEEERRRTIGSAVTTIARVQGLGPLTGSSADLGPPPPDPVEDDTHTFRMEAAPRPPDVIGGSGVRASDEASPGTTTG